MRLSVGIALTVFFAASSAHADTIDSQQTPFFARVISSTFLAPEAACDQSAAGARRGTPLLAYSAAPSAVAPAVQDDQPLHAAAVEHSDAYRTRAKIHKIASFATLPLFAGELALGQSLYNSPTNNGGIKGAHIAVGTGIISLFAVNTVTGAWNLFGEDRQEHDGKTLRFVHALLMMASNAGFVATAATGPHGEGRRGTLTVGTNASTHRAIALTSIGVGTVGYLVMLLGNH